MVPEVVLAPVLFESAWEYGWGWLYVPSLVDVPCAAAPCPEGGDAQAEPAADPKPMASMNRNDASMRIERVEDTSLPFS